MFPCELYNIKLTRTNRLRCIMSSKDDELRYFQEMSRAVAMRASGTAKVMHRNIFNFPQGGIYKRIELPAMQNRNNPGARVKLVSPSGALYNSRLANLDKIVAISNTPTGDPTQIEWQSRTSRRRDIDGWEDDDWEISEIKEIESANVTSPLVERGGSGSSCFSEEELTEMFACLENIW